MIIHRYTYTVEWYDSVVKKWGTRVFTNEPRATRYADGMYDLLKTEDNTLPVSITRKEVLS